MNKIEALKKTIYNLENNIYEYDWDDTDKCNCGVLARTLLSGGYPWENGYGDVMDMEHNFQVPYHGIFSRTAYCMTTKLPLPKVFQVLKETGFDPFELRDLEYLSNNKILEKIGFKKKIEIAKIFHQDKNMVIEYLKAWVEILEENEQPEYKDVTKELIEKFKPIEETSDLINKK